MLSTHSYQSIVNRKQKLGYNFATKDIYFLLHTCNRQLTRNEMIHTIALIDDDQNILVSLSAALEDEGYKVDTYADGEEALR